MVSEKTIIVLITIAILLSAVSIIVTVSTLNTDNIPEIRQVEYALPDTEIGQVGVTISPQSAGGAG